MILCMLLETTKEKKGGGGFFLLCPGIKGSREVKAGRTSFSWKRKICFIQVLWKHSRTSIVKCWFLLTVNDMQSEELRQCYGPDSPVWTLSLLDGGSLSSLCKVEPLLSSSLCSQSCNAQKRNKLQSLDFTAISDNIKEVKDCNIF